MEDLDYFCIKCLKEGNEEAFVALYKKYHRKVYYTAIKLTRSEEMAKDITQDVFLKLWEMRACIDPRQNLEAYIQTICRNRILNIYKKATLEEAFKKEMLLFTGEAESDDEGDFYEEYKVLLDRAIETLPSQRRLVFEHCKLKGKTYEETARHFAISRSTVQDHIVKANKSINEYLQQNSHLSFCLLFSTLSQLAY